MIYHYVFFSWNERSILELLLVINTMIALYIAFGIGANDETMAPLAGSGLKTIERARDG